MEEARTRIVGIVNLTPDSFSDGGNLITTDAALAHMESLLQSGADVLDIGAESTRPGAAPLTPDEEWQRLEEVLVAARVQFPEIILSIDTRHAQTARYALDNGANWINDVSGKADAEMLAVIAGYPQSRYVLMHALSIPADPAQTLPQGMNVLTFLHDWLAEKLALLRKAGISDERVIFDPGIGFGKSAEQSWQLVRKAGELVQDTPVPVLFGHSRKSFLKAISPATEAAGRDFETHMLSVQLAQAGVAYLRVHDVAGTRRALAVANYLKPER